MGREVYLDDSVAAGGKARVILAIFMAIVLAASVSYGIYLKVHRDTALDVLTRFQDAMAAGEYASAVSQLRDVQSRVASASATGGGGRDDALYQESLASMEKIVMDRVDGILAFSGSGSQTLAPDDRRFLEGMGELTGMLVSVKLRELCSGLLTGSVSRDSIDSAFLVLGSLSNLSQPARALRQELDAIENASGTVIEAEKSLSDASYFDALIKFGAIAADMDGFVQEYALARVLDTKSAMLAPLSERARTWLDAGRYYSARDLLGQMKSVFPDDAAIEAMLQESLANTVQTLDVFQGAVEHISIKPLIVTPARAFDGDALSDAIAQGMMTVSEFRSLLEGLYERGYVLIDIDQLLDAGGQAMPVMVPPGKKPLILTIETLNYYAHRAANGLCTNLVMENGNVSGQYIDKSGMLQVNREAEAIGIVETFVESHPDFSYDGAKGILSLTGYEGIFGYVVNDAQLKLRNENNIESGLAVQTLSAAQMADNAQKVVEISARLAASGWRFASSTYAYLEPGNEATTIDILEADAIRWDTEVGALIGGTDILMYPNGAFLSGDDPRCLMLRDRGFRFFAGFGPNAYTYYRENYVYMDKTAINGYSMSNNDLSRFFNAQAARDPERGN